MPVVLGSRSTNVRGGFGGYGGRALRADDLIQAFAPEHFLGDDVVTPNDLIPNYAKEFAVDVVQGPQDAVFAAEGVETFLRNDYTVTPESDRMGYRLQGAFIERKSAVELVTEALMEGVVQVPANGKPIVLMADAQTSGGYPKIATVTTPDVSRLAQAKPNDRVRFNRISLEQAHAEYVEFCGVLARLGVRVS